MNKNEVWVIRLKNRVGEWEVRHMTFSRDAALKYIQNYGSRWSHVNIAPAVIDESREQDYYWGE